jgi:hypothetical protein
MLTTKEKQVKEYMYSEFIPELNKIFEEKNPETYAKWGKNCCQQTAVFGAALLTEMLPDYKWEVWYGIFDDIVMGRPVQYNHAWIWGKHKNENKGLFVDLSRIFHERLFFDTTDNNYPKNHSDYQYMKEIKRIQLDWKRMIKEEIEYYTSMHSQKILSEIKNRINFSKKDFTNIQ